MQPFYILNALIKYYILTGQHLTVRNGLRASQVARTKEYKQHHMLHVYMFNPFSLPRPRGTCPQPRGDVTLKLFLFYGILLEKTM